MQWLENIEVCLKQLEYVGSTFSNANFLKSKYRSFSDKNLTSVLCVNEVWHLEDSKIKCKKNSLIVYVDCIEMIMFLIYQIKMLSIIEHLNI